MPEAENHALPGGTNDIWRVWLMTGVRRSPADRRRLRGANRGLKQILLEGKTIGEDRPHAWKDFSGAMLRHAVDDAMRSLPHQDKEVVKLAYFGGYSNREIARHVGLTETTVQRRLRRALAEISEYIQHGRAFGRRAAYAVLLWLSGRWVYEGAHHIAQAAAVAGVIVIVAAQPAAPVAAAKAPPSHQQAVAAPAPSREPATIPGAASIAPAAVQPAVVVVLPIAVPTLPPLPDVKSPVNPPVKPPKL